VATTSVPLVVKVLDSPYRPPAFIMGARDSSTVVDGDCAPSYLEVWLATLVDLPDQGTARHVLDWLAAAQDAERAGYHSDTFVGMIVSARKPDRGQDPVIGR
jgi:hypothetical protein